MSQGVVNIQKGVLRRVGDWLERCRSVKVYETNWGLASLYTSSARGMQTHRPSTDVLAI